MNETSGVYTFTDTDSEKKEISAGFGVDYSNSFGVSCSVSNESFSISFQVNSMVYLCLGIGMDGISIGLGINTGNITNEFTFTIRPFTMLLFAFELAIIPIFLYIISNPITNSIVNPIGSLVCVTFLIFLIIFKKK